MAAFPQFSPQNTQHPRSVAGTNWIPTLRRSPPFEHDATALCNEITAQMGSTSHIRFHNGEPYPLSFVFQVIRRVLDAIATAKGFDELRLSTFQRDGIARVLVNSWTNNGFDAGVITAETGVGKTLVFMIRAG